MQAAPQVSQNPWWETPTGAAAIVALISAISAPFINSWLQNRKAKFESTTHLTDTSLTVSAQERKEIIQQMERNHEREVLFMKSQLKEINLRAGRRILEAKLSEYEARQRAHMFANECNRMQSQVYKLQMELHKNNIEPPEFVFKTYPEIVQGLDERVIQYKEDLEEEFDREKEKDLEVFDDV